MSLQIAGLAVAPLGAFCSMMVIVNVSPLLSIAGTTLWEIERSIEDIKILLVTSPKLFEVNVSTRFVPNKLVVEVFRKFQDKSLPQPIIVGVPIIKSYVNLIVSPGSKIGTSRDTELK